MLNAARHAENRKRLLTASSMAQRFCVHQNEDFIQKRFQRNQLISTANHKLFTSGSVAQKQAKDDLELAKAKGVDPETIGKMIGNKYYRRKFKYHGTPLLPSTYPPLEEPLASEESDAKGTSEKIASTNVTNFASQRVWDKDERIANDSGDPLRCGQRVRVCWSNVRCSDAEMSYEGQVIETVWQLGKKDASVFAFRVGYDDGDVKWHAFAGSGWTRVEIMEEDCPPQDAIDIDGIAASSDQWEKLEPRCVISMMPLTDPAKGCSCRHRANCNYAELRDYVGRMKACPVAGCDAKLYRTRDVERDDQLRRLLQELPASCSEAIWVRGDELRTTAPARGSQGDRENHRCPQQQRARGDVKRASRADPRQQARRQRSIVVE